MGKLFGQENENCEKFRDALEELPMTSREEHSAEQWRTGLPAEEARHLESCANCREALEEFALTRNALVGLTLPAPGPWFANRVMAAIETKEREEALEGVWISVRRLAPRIVALSALLLVLGGSWAMQQRSREMTNLEGKGGDMVFDAPTTGPNLFDDSVTVPAKVRP